MRLLLAAILGVTSFITAQNAWAQLEMARSQTASPWKTSWADAWTAFRGAAKN